MIVDGEELARLWNERYGQYAHATDGTVMQTTERWPTHTMSPPITQLGGWNKAGPWLQEFPTSPDGTDWGIWGDTLREQWNGVCLEARLEYSNRFPFQGLPHN